MTRKCATPGCERAAAVSSNPAVIFANCWSHTDELLAQAFGASDSSVRDRAVVPCPIPDSGAERHPVSGPAAD